MNIVIVDDKNHDEQRGKHPDELSLYLIVKEEPPSDMQNNGPDSNFGGQSGMPGPLDIKPEDIKPFDDGPTGVNDFANGNYYFTS